MVLPFSLFCFHFKNGRRIFFSCPQTFLHFVPTLQCQICGFVFSTTAPSTIWTIWRIKLHTCVKATRYFQLWHTIINRIGNIGTVVNAHARYNFLYSHICLHLSAPVKRCCPFYLSPLFSHCPCYAFKGFATTFSTSAFSACTLIFWVVSSAVTSRRTIRLIILYDVCRLQWLKTF